MSDEHRSLTPAEVREITDAQRRADISAKREQILHGMELKLAELIGTDGDGGSYAALVKKVDSMDVKLDKIELFTNRAKWTIGLLATAGGSVAALAMVLIEKWLGK